MRNDLDHASSLKEEKKDQKITKIFENPNVTPLSTPTIKIAQSTFQNDILTNLNPEFTTLIDPSNLTRLTRTELLMLFYLLFRSNPIDLYQFMAETNSSRTSCYQARQELARLNFNVQIIESKSSPYYKLFPNKSILRATGLLTDTPDTPNTTTDTTPDTTPDLSPEKN